ncbi:PP2C family protein-serine/threonine phosphatase [Rhizobium beringeri]
MDGGTATLAWAGDSRAYRWRDRELLQLTRDHSVVQELLDDGRLSPNEAWQHPQAHIVTRAIGASDHLVVETTEVSFRPGDALILCSDGLTDCVADAEITALMNAVSTPPVACQRLISAALDNGAPDNVSVIVVQIDGAAIS